MNPGTGMSLNQKLPDEQLLKLFTYFPVDELVSAQRVCSRWRAVALDKSLWKNFTLTVYGKPQDKRYIKTMPALRNIDGDASNDLVDVILDNLTELARMNCMFEPPLSSTQTRRMLEKFPELESISLDIRAPDILLSANVLKASETLKEVKISTHRSNQRFFRIHQSLGQVFWSVFLNDECFTALTDMDISYPDNGLVEVFKKKSSRLSSLKFTPGFNKDVSDAISMCTELHKLQLSQSRDFYSEPPFHIKIENMNQLRSLHIIVGTNFLPAIYDSLFKGSWLHLREAGFCVSKGNMPEINLLHAIIENMKQLKKLRFCVRRGNASENELQNIGSLLHLENLIIDCLDSFSEKGVSYMSHCINLKYFLVHARTSTIDNCNIANIMRPMKKLESMVLGIDNTYKFLSCRQEISEFITQVTAES